MDVKQRKKAAFCRKMHENAEKNVPFTSVSEHNERVNAVNAGKLVSVLN